MNRDNIQYTIDLLKQAQNFNINSFQFQKAHFVADSVEELHSCGNSACIAGYVGLSARWREMGGGVHTFDGCPIPPKNYVSTKELRDALNDELLAAMAKFWGLPQELAETLIYGVYVNPQLVRFGITPPTNQWKLWTKDDAIGVFQQILNLEL